MEWFKEWWLLVVLGGFIAVMLFVVGFGPVADTDTYRAEDGSLFTVVCDKDGWFQSVECEVLR